ncbi:MAG: tetratricopeptide repeat protein [Xenococcaceae cyanobacterium MO_188.B32]|nr:tetratricopeptide repeat protein [Xenococcaceae cyanobacterium MO_188.B32]
MKFDSVLIITYSHSGSTLLQRILNSIEECLVRGENNNFCFGLYEAYNSIKHSKKFEEAIEVTHPWYGAPFISEEAFLRQTSQIAINLILANKKDDPTIKCYGFTEIRYYQPKVQKNFEDYLEFLAKIFPNVCFIFNTRSLDDVLQSKWWLKKDKKKAKQQLLNLENKFAIFCTKHTNTFQITYENIVSKSAKVSEMFDFLGVKYIPDQIDDIIGIKSNINSPQKISLGKKSQFNTINLLDMSRETQSKHGIEPDSKQTSSTYKSLGDALAKQEKFGEAIDAYQKVLELESKNSSIYRAIGHCYNQTNNYREAITNYKKAIALEANQPAWVYKNLGNALAKQKQLDEAISNYEKAVEIESENALAYVGLGHLYLQNRQPDKAFDCYLKAVYLKPNVKTSYGKLGYFHGGHAELNFNQLDKAIECYRQAIDKQSNFFLPYVYLGDSLTAKNELDRAINYYQMAGEKKLLAKYPNLAESQYDLDKVERPNFIVIGAGKSGTSSLYEYICSHSQVISSLKKELRFFNYKPNFHKGVDWYLSHFPPIPKGKNLITGEATPGYFGSDVQESISSLFPNIKLIAILRNPVDRAFSQYNHWVRNGIERRSFREAVISEIEKLEKIFNNIDIFEFQKIEKIKEICYQVHRGNSKEKTGYLWEGLYVYFLQKWTKYFSKEQLLVIKSEDFYAQPEVEMKKVFTFLALPDYHLPIYKKYNAGKYSSLDKQLYDRLTEFFQPHNQRLEEYLNRKFNWI